MKVVVVGGGIAGLAAARTLESLLPEVDIVLVERTERLGGKLLTEHVDGFGHAVRVEGAVGITARGGTDAEEAGRRPCAPLIRVR